MSLVEDLASGRRGIRWSPPASIEWKQTLSSQAIAADAERRLIWFVRFFPWRIDLRRAFDDVLRGDLEVEARALFEAAYKPAEWPPGSGETRPPRTADPGWSPVVETEHVSLGGVPALRVVRRLTYQPGNESLSGALLVPLSDGYAEISAIARTETTGFRESVLMVKATPKMEPGMELPKQSVYDDPAHDEMFPDHPLTVVRAALRWLISDAGLEVTSPMGPAPEGEVVLEGPGCAVVPPPRFLFVPREVLPMAPTLASFVRVSLGDAPPRLLDVWRLKGRITGRDRGEQLRALAEKTTADWASEGAADIQQSPKIIGGDGATVGVRNLVRYTVEGKPKISAQRWRVDGDGTVLRVALGGGGHVPDAGLVEDAELVMASLRRLDGGAGEPAGQKPRWNVS